MKKNILKTKNKKLKKAIYAGKRGFTLVELMIVIAIIGILAGVVTVSMKSSVDKSKRASALTSAASVLPELVTCADDGGVVSTPAANSDICTGPTGHENAHWPNINEKTGWAYGSTSGTLALGNYVFCLTKSSETSIRCSMAENGCCDAGVGTCGTCPS